MNEDYQGLTPPPELVERLRSEVLYGRTSDASVTRERLLIHAAYRAGADRRLEACVEWLVGNDNPRWALALQEAMTPKPPSLAEQALQALERMDQPRWMRSDEDQSTIRRALGRLQELENNG